MRFKLCSLIYWSVRISRHSSFYYFTHFKMSNNWTIIIKFQYSKLIDSVLQLWFNLTFINIMSSLLFLNIEFIFHKDDVKIDYATFRYIISIQRKWVKLDKILLRTSCNINNLRINHEIWITQKNKKKRQHLQYVSRCSM